MPDKWEYPWFAAWDLAFHMIPFARIDPDFAKEQLMLLPARVVHAPERPDARLRVRLRRRQPAGARLGRAGASTRSPASRGKRDRDFLERVFQKLLINFTWWVNRKDAAGQQPLLGRLPRPRQHRRLRPLASRCPTGGYLEQADGTAWMAFYCTHHAGDGAGAGQRRPGLRGHGLEVLRTLRRHRRRDEPPRRHRPVGRAGRLLLRPAARRRTARMPLRDALDGGRRSRSSRSRCSTTTPDRRLPGFAKRMRWFLDNRPDLAEHIILHARRPTRRRGARRCWPSPRASGCVRVLRYVLDENEFLSPYGIRSLSQLPPRPPLSSSTPAARAPRRLRARRVDDAACSAATPTGAARSGSRSTTCSSRRSSATTTSTATACRSSARPAPGAC